MEKYPWGQLAGGLPYRKHGSAGGKGSYGNACSTRRRKPYGIAFRHKKRALPNSRKRCIARER